MGFLPQELGQWLGRSNKQGGVWTALRMTELIGSSHAVFKEMTPKIDRFVAVCNWGRDVLLVNGVPVDKISVSRHGINWVPIQTSTPAEQPVNGASRDVRLAFIGRMDASKGLHVLINALKRTPTLKVRLDVYGITQSLSGSAYQSEIQTLAAGDPRVSFHKSVPSSEIVPLLRQFDFLAVPSQWMETGPLVVLEAFAAGTPVICSDLGGPKELVRDGIDGLLVERYGEAAAWADVLTRIAGNAQLRGKLKSGVRPPKRSAEVTDEMLALYRAVLKTRETSFAGGTQVY